ncbi:hypothetical protein ACOMSG_03090 [Macellibacteroides fermentans]|uniref:hypothetical protein n=1 Tax=Macellibacteroides fermentans TaxID=879969 RepID=UPI003B928907
MNRKLDIIAEWVVWGSLGNKRDLETILLKGHLLLEMILSMLLSRNGFDNCNDNSFYRKIGLLRNLNTTDQVGLKKIITALVEINNLRNKLAHEILFKVNDSNFSTWAIGVLENFEGTKFTKYTHKTKIIHAFSILSKNILDLDKNSNQ